MDQISPESKNETRRRIVNGHIATTVWWLAWPSIITMILQTGYGLIDALFLGRLGAATLAGLGVANQVLLVLMAFSAAVGVGSTALVARFIGAEDNQSAEEVTKQSILLAIISATISGVLLYAFGPSLIKLMAEKGEGVRLGVIYLDILLAGNVFSFLTVIVTGVYRGLGDVRTPLIATTVATVINVVGDYILIFGIGPFPKLGIAGAAIAVVTSRAVSTAMLLAYLPKTHIPNVLKGSWKPSWKWFARILNIGYPAAVQALLRTGASMTYFGILRRSIDGENALAALTIGLRTEALAFMPGFAFSVAAASMVGQNLGARQPERAEKGAWAATWQGIWIMGGIGLLFVFFSHQIADLFTNDIRVLPLASSYLWVNGLSEPFLALGMILTGALQGAGETRLPTLATILTLWIIRLPLTYLLAITLNFGAFGAWVAMSSSTVFSGLAVLGIFKWTNWSEKEV